MFPEKSSKKNKIILCCFAVLPALTIICEIFLDRSTNDYIDYSSAMPSTSVAWVNDSTLSFDGPITGAAYHKLDAALSTPRTQPATTLVINSPGGDAETAEKIASLLNTHNLKIEVAPNGLCASACVPLFLHTTSHVNRENAAFIFHQGLSFRMDPYHGFIKTLGLGSNTAPVLMDPWVKEWGPPLFEFLSSCTDINPLRSEIGISLTWSEIQAILKGHPQRSCDAALRAYQCTDNESAPPFCKQ